jgi:hypothetical protein
MRRSFQILHSVKPSLSILLFLASMILASLALSSTVLMFKEELLVRDLAERLGFRPLLDASIGVISSYLDLIRVFNIVIHSPVEVKEN